MIRPFLEPAPDVLITELRKSPLSGKTIPHEPDNNEIMPHVSKTKYQRNFTYGIKMDERLR